MKKHTKCRMDEMCRRPHRDGECERNCYYNTIEVKTNADKLRSMSDEELAAWLCDVAGWLPTFEGRVHPILEWLRQEAIE